MKRCGNGVKALVAAMLAGMMLCFALGCAGGSNSSSSSSDGDQPSSAEASSAAQVSESSASSSESSASSSEGDYKLGSIGKEAADYHHYPVVSEDTARKALSFTLEGVEYTLPLDPKQLIENGWVATNIDGATIEPNHLKSGVSFQYGDRSEHKFFTATIINAGSEPIDVLDGVLVGISVRHGQDNDYRADFQTALSGSDTWNAQDAIDLYGFGDDTYQSKEETRYTIGLMSAKDNLNTLDGYGKIEYYVSVDDESWLKQIAIEYNYKDKNPLNS